MEILFPLLSSAVEPSKKCNVPLAFNNRVASGTFIQNLLCMEENGGSLPLAIARLIVRYTHNLLTDVEQDELDRWLEAADKSLEIFEELTDGLESKVLSADELIIETDDLLDTWMIAGLIARDIQGILSSEEKQTLAQWVNESVHNRALYQSLTDKANLHRFAVWFRQLRNQRGGGSGLN